MQQICNINYLIFVFKLVQALINIYRLHLDLSQLLYKFQIGKTKNYYELHVLLKTRDVQIFQRKQMQQVNAKTTAQKTQSKKQNKN